MKVLTIKKHSSKLKFWSVEMPNSPYSNSYKSISCMLPVDVCVTETYDNGKVTSTTNLASPNTTIKILNSQEASDPNLEQNLENRKYHIIETTTTSGAKLQKTIYKDGN